MGIFFYFHIKNIISIYKKQIILYNYKKIKKRENIMNIKGNIVLKDCVMEGYVSTENGIITYVGKTAPKGEIIDFGDNYITPGLIDIHCHSSMTISARDNPTAVADFHLTHGVTSMLLTFYKDTPHDKLLSALSQVKSAMKSRSNILGAHLEGPYINSNLGYDDGRRLQIVPEKEKYESYIASGVIKQWTFSPEIEGVIPVIKRVAESGIIPSIGHSLASYSQVKAAYDNGAKIVTHIFDATGITDNAEFKGTKDLSFDEACMLMDDMFYEVICDGEWVHVRKQMLDLLIKTVGIDRIVAITDLDVSDVDESEDDSRDIAVANGQLAGTKLTLDKVCFNLFNAGYNVYDIFKMTSLTPAKALNVLDRGQIKEGLKADLCVFDKNMKFVKII